MGDKKNHYRKYVTRICERCGKEYTQRSDYKSKFCGYECYWESMKTDHSTVCPVCGITFNKEANQKYCSRKCQGIAKRGKPHPHTNGISKNRQGYVREYINGKYVLQHRLVVEQAIGRKLRDDEIVHHKDRNKSNNSLDNLEIMSSSEHTRMHEEELQKRKKAEADG